MKEAYGIMLTLNRSLNRKQFNEEYMQIRLYVQNLPKPTETTESAKQSEAV